MVTTPPSIRTLAGQLSEDLRVAYEASAPQQPHGSQPLREAFDRFGTAAVEIGISLEDAMAGGIDALQALFERVGGNTADPATMIAAGIALAALGRAYHRAEA